MRSTKKILLGLTVILALICVLAIAISATEYKIPVRAGWEEAGGPMGVIHDDTAGGWKDSGYSDIDDHVNFSRGDNDVWVMIATNGTADLKSDKYPNLTYGNSYYAYFNEYEKKVIIVAQGNLHSQLSAYYKQETYEGVLDKADNYAQYDVLFNMFALEYIFTQDAYKDISVPGLDMTWATYMSTKIGESTVHDIAYPAVANDSTPTSTNAIFVMERAIADYFYNQYNADSSYSAALSNTTTDLTGSSFKPTKDSQKRSRALLTGLVLWAQANGIDAQTVDALRVAAVADAKADIFKFYALKGSGGTFGWADGAENYLGDYGYVAMAFLINPNTTENANVGCLGKYVDTLELRNPGSSTRNFQNFGSVLTAFDKTTKVLIDTTLVTFRPESNASLDRGMFRKMDSLTTMAHVTFAKNGTYNPDDVEDGVVKLSGFTANARPEYGYTGYMLYGSTAVTDVVYYEKLMWASSGGSVDVSGVIYDYTLDGSTALKTFTIPANADTPLSQIGKNVFANSGLKEMYVLRAVSEDLTIASTAFSGCKSVTMYVLDKTSAANAYKALNTAGIKNVAVELFNPVENPVSSTGVLVKMKDFTSASSDKLAIRFQFLWEEKGAAATANAAGNYTFKGLGIITSTADTYASFETKVKNETGLALGSLVAQEMLKASSDPENKVINVLVTNADFTDGRRTFLSGYNSEAGYYPFCLSLYGMTGDQITSEYYVAAYTEWTDGENTFYTFTTLDYTKDGKAKNSISLYDSTLGLVKQGRINGSNYKSPEAAQKYFYSVLELGALTTSSFNTPVIGANVGYTLDNGSFTYWNVDYRKYALNPSFTGGSLAAGWGYKPDTVEALPSSGVQWSILKDGAKYIVLITKNKNAAPDGVDYDYKVPTSGRNSQYSYYQPFHYLYGDVNKAATNAKDKGSMTVYSPAVTQAVFNAITTIVVDDGIVSLDKDSLSYVTPATTYVLPKTCTTVEAYAISKNANLVDIIWTGDPDAKSESKYNVEYLYDLRGCSTVSNGSLLCDNKAAVNVVTQNGVNVDGQLTFNNAAALERYWSASGYSGYSKPAAGTIDVSKGWHGNINKGYFNGGSKITTIIVKGTLKSSHNTFTSGEDDRSYQAYGAKRGYNFILVDDSGKQIDYAGTTFITYLQTYITDLHAGAKAAQASNCDNLSVNGVSVKTIFPDLFS